MYKWSTLLVLSAFYVIIAYDGIDDYIIESTEFPIYFKYIISS